jgi:hypothetical protein
MPLTGQPLSDGAPRSSREGSRPRSLGTHPMRRKEREKHLRVLMELDALGIDQRRPRTLAECPPPSEPCPFVSCRFHMALEIEHRPNRQPAVKLMFPHLGLAEMRETCSLRVANRGDRLTDERVGELLGLTAERVRQTEHTALAKLRAAMEAMAWDGATPPPA